MSDIFSIKIIDPSQPDLELEYAPSLAKAVLSILSGTAKGEQIKQAISELSNSNLTDESLLHVFYQTYLNFGEHQVDPEDTPIPVRIEVLLNDDSIETYVMAEVVAVHSVLSQRIPGRRLRDLAINHVTILNIIDRLIELFDY